MSTFQSLGLPQPIASQLARLQILQPSDIQRQAYQPLSQGRDAWLSAPTGSGKTLAYLLPLVAKMDLSTTELQVAVLAPTQELAVQIHDCLRQLDASGALGLRSQLLIGNASSKRQKEKLKQKPQIVVGSCGRMLELGRSGKLKLHKCQAVCIDESDTLLAVDQIDDLQAFLKMTPRDRQLVFASATEKGDAFHIAESLGRQLEWIRGEAIESGSGIEHCYIESSFHRKPDALIQFLQSEQPAKALVFTHRNATAEDLGQALEQASIPHSVWHGGMSKFERQRALTQFRTGSAPVLIASDVAARGMDIKGLSHVINFDLPTLSDDYLHRVGRTGRMGASGRAISIITAEDHKLIQRYERDLQIRIQERL
ncbi:MAG: DEAD/DEAH box helicase [Puniceicoccaceae bacterium]|nr:MAG: DEAD/DEAH box helicase [Puniceicoccaceae bacterium]